MSNYLSFLTNKRYGVALQKYNLDDFTKNSYDTLFADETGRMFKSVPLEHHASEVSGLFAGLQSAWVD